MLADLKRALELLPPGSAVTLGREILLEALGEGGAKQADAAVVDAGGDLTVDQLAVKLNRSASTVRGWLEQGLFPGAYHLPASDKRSKKTGRAKMGAWRIPEAAFEAFRAGQQSNGMARRRSRPSLGDWRQVLTADAR